MALRCLAAYGPSIDNRAVLCGGRAMGKCHACCGPLSALWYIISRARDTRGDEHKSPADKFGLLDYEISQW
jgi:hypothetical protein